MTKEELVDAVAEVLYLSDDLEKIPPGTDWEHVVAEATVDIAIPMVTEDIAAAIDAKRVARLAEDWDGPDGDIADDAHEAGMEFAFRIAERIAKEWKPE